MTIKSEAESRIKKFANIAIYICYFSILVTLIVAFIPFIQVMIDSPYKDYIFLERIVPKPLTITPVAYGRELAAIVMFLPTCFAIYLLFSARSLFTSFMRGEILTSEAAIKFQSFGWILFFIPFINFIGKTAAATALTSFKNIEELLFASLLSWLNLLALLIGLVLVLAGKQLQETLLLKEENNSFV